MQKFKVRGDSRCIYQNELDKACFQHDIAYEDFQDLTRRTVSDYILHDKVFNIAKNQKYDEYQRAVTSVVYIVFDIKFNLLAGKSASSSGIKNKNVSNKDLLKRLKNQSLNKMKKTKEQSPILDKI